MLSSIVIGDRTGIRVDGIAEDLTAAGVVKKDLVLLECGEMRADRIHVQPAINNHVCHIWQQFYAFEDVQHFGSSMEYLFPA